MDFEIIDLKNFRNHEENIRHIWKDYHLSLGVSLVDIQHLWLVYIITSLETIDKNIEIAERIKNIIKILEQCLMYTNEHFSAEIILIEMLKFKTDHHKKEHHNFLKFVQKELDEFRHMDLTDNRVYFHKVNELHDYLRDWLLGHIAITDRDPILFLRKQSNREVILKEWLEKIKSSNLLKIRKSQKLLYDIIDRDMIYFSDQTNKNVEAGEVSSQNHPFSKQDGHFYIEIDTSIAEHYVQKSKEKNLTLSDYINSLLKKAMDRKYNKDS